MSRGESDKLINGGTTILIVSLIFLYHAYASTKTSTTYWTPYQKLTVVPLDDDQYQVNVNNAGYMSIANVSPNFLVKHAEFAQNLSKSSYDAPFRFIVSVRLWPSCVEGIQLLGALRFCRRINFVSENVVCLSPGDGEIQPGQQLSQRFTFSAFQHGQGVSSFVGHSDTFRERRNDSDADSTLFDCLFDVGQVWETACGGARGGFFVQAA
jgi:hypothetical protein